MQDEMIVDLYWKRDESAISETERKYGRYLSKIAYNILSDWEDSKEAVNDTYLKAWNSMPTHKPGVLSAYLGKITRQLSIDAFRTRNRDKRKHSEYAVSLSELEDCISSSETTEQSIELKLLAEAINTYNRQYGGVNFIFADSNLSRDHRACGEIDVAAIIELVKGGMTNVLLCHHSFTQEYGDTHDVINGGERFLEILAGHEIKFLIHGHTHRAAIDVHPYTVKEIGCGSFSKDSKKMGNIYKQFTVGCIREGTIVSIERWIDTDDGGEPFAVSIEASIQQLLIKTRELLSSCNCDSACHKCLKHYRNQYVHGLLDRSAALDLLTWAEKGVRSPMLPVYEQRNLLQSVEQILQFSGVHIDFDHEPIEAESFHGKKRIVVYPAMWARPTEKNMVFVSDSYLKYAKPYALKTIVDGL